MNPVPPPNPDSAEAIFAAKFPAERRSVIPPRRLARSTKPTPAPPTVAPLISPTFSIYGEAGQVLLGLTPSSVGGRYKLTSDEAHMIGEALIRAAKIERENWIKCGVCGGEGRALIRWSPSKGLGYQDCPECHGSRGFRREL